MKKVLVINGHPYDKSLCNALADSYENGAKASGQAEVKRINLYNLKFDPILHKGYHEIQELEPDLKMTQEAILWADHLVFVYPTWWLNMPALMKGFIDRTILPGFAFKYEGSRLFAKKLLKGKSARLIITMDAPVWFNWLMYGNEGHSSFHKGVLDFSGVSPIKCTSLDEVKFRKPEKIAKWLKKIEQMGRNLK
jgi:putative NADPH-quinone reductase